MENSNLQIIYYPHPTLRYISKTLKHVDAELRAMVGRIFELMYEHRGVGLAANQVDLPYRLFVTNVEGDPDVKEAECVYMNPVLSGAKGMDEAEEGCLSIPNVVGLVKRSERITIRAYSLTGEEIAADLVGLPARIVQHETDHLDGTLFIDRLSTTSEMSVREALQEFQIEFKSKRQLGGVPNDKQIADRLAELESKRA